MDRWGSTAAKPSAEHHLRAAQLVQGQCSGPLPVDGWQASGLFTYKTGSPTLWDSASRSE